jgi:hypothetical protein
MFFILFHNEESCELFMPSKKKILVLGQWILKKGQLGYLFFVFISNPTWEGFLYFVFIFSGLKT